MSFLTVFFNLSEVILNNLAVKQLPAKFKFEVQLNKKNRHLNVVSRLKQLRIRAVMRISFVGVFSQTI